MADEGPGYYLDPRNWGQIASNVLDQRYQSIIDQNQKMTPGNVAGDALSTAMSVLPAGVRIPKLYHGSRAVFDRPDLGKVGTGTDLGASGRPSLTGDEGWGFNTTTSKWGAEAYAKQGLQSPGHLYEITAPRTSPEQLLDWSKPMAEQSPYVRERLPWPDQAMTGEGVYRSLSRGFPNRPGEHADKAVSEFLSSTGIPGHRTGVSTFKGEPHESFIWYRTDILDALKKYGLVGTLGGAGAAQTLGLDDGR